MIRLRRQALLFSILARSRSPSFVRCFSAGGAPLASVYEPEKIEMRLYESWEAQGLFKPDTSLSKKFTMLLPPPNVTGALHIGHALTVTIQVSPQLPCAPSRHPSRRRPHDRARRAVMQA